MKAELKIEEEPLFFIISLFGDAKLILITVNELNRVWENYVKSVSFCAPFLSFRQDGNIKKSPAIR